MEQPAPALVPVGDSMHAHVSWDVPALGWVGAHTTTCQEGNAHGSKHETCRWESCTIAP